MSYVRTAEHIAAIVAFNRRTKRKYPIGYDTGSRLYQCWRAMLARCYQASHEAFDRYNGRGIGVCEEWRDYAAFLQWALNNGYAEDLTIERCDNNKGYSPDNCRWATMSEQNRNRRDNIRVTAFGETKVLKDWAQDARCQISYVSLCRRIRTGCDAEWSITAPPRAIVRRKPMKEETKRKIGDRARERGALRDIDGRFIRNGHQP